MKQPAPIAPLYETIYAVLRDHLQRGALPPGLVLGPAAIGRAFNTSRIPAGRALKRLHGEGLVVAFEGRGFLIPGSDQPLRQNLAASGLELPEHLKAQATGRNRRDQLYPEVEHAVAACLVHGRFMLNESALAEHYGVSRTVAHEVLTQLERAGVISKDSNQRWYAGPLSARDLTGHFEMRWLLEPEALRQAFPQLESADLRQRRDRVIAAQADLPEPLDLERIEADLHVDTLAACRNLILLDTLRRSQRVLLVTHSTFKDYQRREELSAMAADHLHIYDALLAGDRDLAASTLESHLRRSLQPNLDLLGQLAPLPDDKRPSYLLPVREPRVLS